MYINCINFLSRRKPAPPSLRSAFCAVAGTAGFVATVLLAGHYVRMSVAGPVDCPAIGDECYDGSIYAGRSLNTGGNIFVAQQDAPYAMGWEQATEYSDDLDLNGHTDWRLPNKEELHTLYENRDKGALKGTFDQSSSDITSWYWTSIEHPAGPRGVWVETFRAGKQTWSYKDEIASVRAVRSEPKR